MNNDFYDTIKNETATTLEREHVQTGTTDPVRLAEKIVANLQQTFKRYGWTEQLETLSVSVGKSMGAGYGGEASRY